MYFVEETLPGHKTNVRVDCFPSFDAAIDYADSLTNYSDSEVTIYQMDDSGATYEVVL